MLPGYVKYVRFLFFCYLVFQCLQFTNASTRIAVFEEHFSAPDIIVDQDQLYLWDHVLMKIRIYSRKDFSKIADFGREGRGPAEFESMRPVTLQGDRLYVGGFPKIVAFSNKGKYIEEKKGPPDTGNFTPIADNFLGTKYPYSKPGSKKRAIIYILMDDDLENPREIFGGYLKPIFRHNRPKQDLLLIPECAEFHVYKGQAFIANTLRGFYFAVFNSDGKKLYDIKRPYEKVPVTSAQKKERIKSYKSNSLGRHRNAYNLVFPEYYPAFASFQVADDKIYAVKHILHAVTDKRRDVEILDMKGNFIRKSTIPAVYRLCIFDGKCYYMVENEDTENWELHGEEIK
ncbi:MAG: hypothetical protein GY765_14660 [bacterium]|nr:hypothetical protein [bacterium]